MDRSNEFLRTPWAKFDTDYSVFFYLKTMGFRAVKISEQFTLYVLEKLLSMQKKIRNLREGHSTVNSLSFDSFQTQRPH